MKNEDIKRRIKKLEAKLPQLNPDGEAIVKLLDQGKDFLGRQNQGLTDAEREDLKVFLDNYPFKPKRGGNFGEE